jgi:hypothetical protein
VSLNTSHFHFVLLSGSYLKFRRNELGRSRLGVLSRQRRNLIFLYNYMPHHIRSRDGAVGISTGYGMDDRGVGVRVPVGTRVLLLHVVQTGSGANPTIQ